jgi:putative transcriptional regulator
MEKEQFLRQVGNCLRKLREEKNLTQADVANLIGKDRQSYQRIETGGTNTTIWYLYKIAKALDIPLTKIMEEIGE